MYLLDTNIISEVRKISQNKANQGVIQWVSSIEFDQCYISAITLLELEQGILRVKHRGDIAQYFQLQQWFDQYVLPTFKGRILSIDEHTVRICAQLHVPDKRPYNDALIAACAIQHKLTLVTRNTTDFIALNVPLFDPFQ
ncbi:type II toxin-antitoxin system VapC family toxin [Conservatibacter flavescens]|uniref:VapC toxin family PIN domain ribonuclease n=1 Tax=Conservatibacter flavescens TaxID=28161 RepID=A0A2M8S118_9PAST|nr:type II toxin-antitoxin system VapC family toxin [Conservatibacter flavescens]PJG84852.1 VapC toxin family PIN domain ribonuclease [Conservatibacter flavescens]